MKTELHTAASRGHVKFDWLDTYHYFSFGQYHNPARVHFGALRVINDDHIDAGFVYDEPEPETPKHVYANYAQSNKLVNFVRIGRVSHSRSNTQRMEGHMCLLIRTESMGLV
jgi:redox-sensitive bicupin YhaK (pirin superfamily)